MPLLDSSVEGPALVVGVIALTYLLTALLPGRRVDGYCLDPATGRPQKYRLNGLLVLVVVAGFFLGAVKLRWVDASVFQRSFLESATTATIIGVWASLAFVIRGIVLLAKDKIDRRDRCPTRDSVAATAADKKSSNSNSAVKRSPSPSSSRKRASSPSSSPSSRRRSPSPAASRKKSPAPAVEPVVAAASDDSTKVDSSEFDSRSIISHFYCGLSEFNPRGWLGVDVKMWLYVIGAVQLQLNVLSCLFFSASNNAGADGLNEPSLAATTYAGLMTFFLVEYLFQEAVHLQTYDLFRERIGFKLLFGCLAFYPFFYATGGLAIAFWEAKGRAAAFPSWAAALTILLFFFGWILTRGANLQKAACKEGRKQFSFLFGLVKPSMETLPGSNGRILCGGFWGLARHINYCGEILQATALSLPAFWLAGGPQALFSLSSSSSPVELLFTLLPLLYPLYYVGLFIPRCIDDGLMCERKYGSALWGEYTKRVKWNMIPGLW